RMVAVVAAMSGKIERDGEAFLPGGDVAAVEGVGILGRGEAGILLAGPRLRDVHGGGGTAQIGRDAGERVEKVEPLDVLGSVDRLHRNAFGREPGWSNGGGRRGARRLGERDLGEIRNAGHRFDLRTHDTMRAALRRRAGTLNICAATALHAARCRPGTARVTPPAGRASRSSRET